MAAVDVILTTKQRGGLVQQGGGDGGQVFWQAVNILVQVRLHQVKNAASGELIRLRSHTVLHKPVGILRNDVCDISLNLQLTERVLVSTDGGISTVEAELEPDEPEEMWTVKRG